MAYLAPYHASTPSTLSHCSHLQLLLAASRYKELRAVLMEQLQHREGQQREQERLESQRQQQQQQQQQLEQQQQPGSPVTSGELSGGGGGVGGSGNSLKGDATAAVGVPAAAVGACSSGLLQAQGTNHYETMSQQVGGGADGGRLKSFICLFCMHSPLAPPPPPSPCVSGEQPVVLPAGAGPVGLPRRL